MTSQSYLEIESLLRKATQRMRVRSWIMFAMMLALSSLMVALILLGAPWLLAALGKPTPWTLLSPFLYSFSITYIFGAVFLFMVSSVRKWGNVAEPLFVALVVVTIGFLSVLSLRLYHARTIDLLWACAVPIGYLIQFYVSQAVSPWRVVAVPSEKVERFAQRLNLEVLSTSLMNVPAFTTIVFDPQTKYSEKWEFFLARCAMSGVEMVDISSHYERRLGRVHYKDGGFWGKPVSSFQHLYWPFKRLMEVAIILVTVPVWLPLLFIAMLVIKLDDGGPIFFNQKRMGQFGHEFTMFKLRTMRQIEHDPNRPTIKDDARITRPGRILRKFRIDEIPQFFNILKSEMALIGPRADWRHAETHFENLSIYHMRHLGKPGITGWAQVRQGYTETADEWREKLEYDLYYIRNVSILLDLKIIFRTLSIILTGFGSR